MMGLRTLVAISLVTLGFTAHADTPHIEDDSDLPEWTGQRIGPFHAGLSRWVESTSRRIDGFFGTTDALTVDTDSYLRISQEFDWREAEDFDQDLSVRFRLDLPTTEERLRLIIEGEPDETRGTLGEQESSLTDNRVNNIEDVLVGLRRLGEGDRTKEWDTELGAGVKVRLPLDPYARITTQRLWSLNDSPWLLHSDNRFSWFNEDGYSARTRWDLGRAVDKKRHLRFLTNAQWRETEDTLEFSQAAELNQRINNRSVLRYSAVVLGESLSHTTIEDSYLQLRFRRDIHKGFTFLDVAPALHFPREADRDPRWALTLRLEMYFRRHIDRVSL
ncbi:hypothetical protein [Halomonas daqiaonensis]|uniref:Beta-barrel porin 2 n=1 Tax=Halomonas daqiaonensis TaxID=650850 RepID=A0A1H7KN95_9GAMM|nr:hypothetical protein [Halomonas daqiaonensis]SEK88218.1 hypothetical protein SAMN04488129_10552 [Halomonas daqiaonensis]